MNRLSFDIPKESSAIIPNQPGLDNIVDAACNSIKKYLDEYLTLVGSQKEKRIREYTTTIAPQYRHLMKYASDRIAALKPDLSNDELDDALFGIKRDFYNQSIVILYQFYKHLIQYAMENDIFVDSELKERVLFVNVLTMYVGLMTFVNKTASPTKLSQPYF